VTLGTSPFGATLSPRERRLAGRLESFGDIVFGFAVSQCALQLPTAHGHVDLAHPFALVLYFGTFALIASLWLIYHRMLSGTYRPSGIDLIVAFSYLALVSLVPYAMYALSHETQNFVSARAAVAEYTALYGTMTVLSSVLTYRNLRRGYFYLDGDERTHAWGSLLRHIVLCVMMFGGCAVDVKYGPAIGGCFLFLIAPAIRLTRIAFGRLPSPARLGIREV
jgi:uncharacterized membrane protein